MPDFMSHSLFAEDTLALLPPARRGQLDSHSALLTLGAQGPDPLFYYGRGPFQDDRGYYKLAGKLHTIKTDEFLARLWRNVKEGGVDLAERYAYAWGFTGHYALDTQCHPYVYAQAGFAFNGAKRSHEMTANHVMLEAAIDTSLYRKKTGEDVKRLKLWTLTPKEIPDFLEEFYREMSGLYEFPGYQEGDFAKAVKDMQLAQRVLYDPHGWKEGLSRILSRLKGKSVYLGKPVYPAFERLRDLDYMNEFHADWPHPMDEATVYTDSFVDLYDQALARMNGYLAGIESYLVGERELDGLFEGFSYDTMLRWDSEKNKRKVSGQGLMHGRL